METRNYNWQASPTSVDACHPSIPLYGSSAELPRGWFPTMQSSKASEGSGRVIAGSVDGNPAASYPALEGGFIIRLLPR